MTAIPAGSSTFLPANLDCSDFANLQPLYEDLLNRPLDSVKALSQWLADFSALTEAVSEYGSRTYIDKACHTDDKAIESKYLSFIENVSPKIQPLYFELQKKYLACEHTSALDQSNFGTLDREWRTDVGLFRQENIPLRTDEAKLVSEYDKLNGSMTVLFDGVERTLPQLAKYSEQTDRALRQRAWEAAEAKRMEQKQTLDDLFDKLLSNRQQQAINAGDKDYRQHAWKSRYRFDYTPQDCESFAEAVEATCTPLVRELDRKRRAALKVPTLRPWDLSVDVLGRGPLTPFFQEEILSFVERTTRVIERVSPRLAKQFQTLRMGTHLDLESRSGKRPGGFQSSLEQSRQPFIFMNATGRQADVETLLHEAGHAFHYIASSTIEPIFTRHAPLEFCEVASMSMELLTADALDVFYDTSVDQGSAHARAKRILYEGILRIFPWIAVVDSFQHWLYTHPGHSQTSRQDAWLNITGRLMSSEVDWSGYEISRKYLWQRQVHIFNYPFYYIEYGIAQLGALQLWMNYQRDPEGAIEHYLKGLALGGTRPLPDLFAAAGVRFDLSRATLEPLMQELGRQLDALPA
jgi:oligoendopeptidase F